MRMVGCIEEVSSNVAGCSGSFASSAVGRAVSGMTYMNTLGDAILTDEFDDASDLD